MADGHGLLPAVTTPYRAGYVLMWVVSDPTGVMMGAMADVLKLGDWGVTPIGCGGDCWFDLVLNRDIDPVTLTLAFNGVPTHVY